MNLELVDDKIGLLRIQGLRREDITMISESLRLLDYFSLLPPHLQVAPAAVDKLLGFTGEVSEPNTQHYLPRLPNSATTALDPLRVSDGTCQPTINISSSPLRPHLGLDGHRYPTPLCYSDPQIQDQSSCVAPSQLGLDHLLLRSTSPFSDGYILPCDTLPYSNPQNAPSQLGFGSVSSWSKGIQLCLHPTSSSTDLSPRSLSNQYSLMNDGAITPGQTSSPMFPSPPPAVASPSNPVHQSTLHHHRVSSTSQHRLGWQAPGLHKATCGGEPLVTPRYDNCSHSAVPPRRNGKRWGYRSSPYITSSQQVDAILAELAAAHWDSSTHDVPGWVRSIGQLLQEQVIPLQDQSLHFVVSRCSRLHARDLRVNFLWMINLIQLVAKCQSIRHRKGGVLSLAKIHRHELQSMPERPCLSTFMEWHAMGSKFAALAGGGSVYLLILIAGLGLRVSIGSLPGDTPWALANILRAPTEVHHRELVEKFIAPTVARMKATLPVVMDYHRVWQACASQSLSDSDDFYDSFDFSSFKLLKRDVSVWTPAMAVSSISLSHTS